MYVIEKGVPLPEISPHASVRADWPDSLAATFLKMEPGDSLLTTKTLQAISAAAARSGVNVTSRKEGISYRVWRRA